MPTVLDDIRRRIHDLFHDHQGEQRYLMQRRERVEGEREALGDEDERYQKAQQEYEQRLRAYEAELGRYIPFERRGAPERPPAPPADA